MTSLRTEQEIAAAWRQGNPLISVICLTYNHEAYVKQALNSILAQVSTFPFEIIVRDDSSDDGTPSILRSYSEEYPNLFKLLLKNTRSWPSTALITEPLAFAKGAYIAFCEGDDYWIGDHKLQEQATFLEQHVDYGLVAHRSFQIQEQGGCPKLNPPLLIGRATKLAVNQLPNCHTSSLVIRQSLINEIPKWFDEVLPKDIPLMALAASRMKSVVFEGVYSTYRVHQKGASQQVAFEAERVQMLKVLRREIRGMRGHFDYLIGLAFAGTAFAAFRNGDFRGAFCQLRKGSREIQKTRSSPFFLLPVYVLQTLIRRLLPDRSA